VFVKLLASETVLLQTSDSVLRGNPITFAVNARTLRFREALPLGGRIQRTYLVSQKPVNGFKNSGFDWNATVIAAATQMFSAANTKKAFWTKQR